MFSDRLLTNDEAAELLTVSRSTLYKLRDNTPIPARHSPNVSA